MQKINIKEARRHISHLLDKVNAGEEIIILRRGEPAARLSQIDKQELKKPEFPDRSEFRRKLPPVEQDSISLIRNIRDERG